MALCRMRAEMGEKDTTKTKKRKKRRLGRWVGILFVMVIGYVLINIFLIVGNSLQTTIVQNGVEEDVLTAEGYIFRDSTIVTAPVSGYLLCEVAEEERVKKGETVASIYKNEINFHANSEIRALDDKIERLSNNSLELDVFSNDPVRIEQNISNTLRNLHSLSYKRDAEGVVAMRDSVDVLITKKRIIAGEQIPDTDKELDELKALRTQIEKNNNVDRTLVHSSSTGAFTAVVDGLEEALSEQRISDITPTYIRELDKKKIENIVKDKVNAGDPIGKVVNNFSWNVAVVIPEEEAERMSVGDHVGIRFAESGGDAVDGTIVRISEAEKDKVAVVINSNKYINSVYSTSKAEVEIVNNSYEGYRIPSKSIRIIDKQKGVYVIRNDAAKFIPVKTLYTNGDWVIVSEKIEGGETIKLYDELIVSGKDLYNGKDVR